MGPPEQMRIFLKRHFNCNLKAILQDFPKPNCPAMEMPRLDDDVKKQVRSKGKDPQFGAEKTMFKIQEELLEVGGPLTCLWSDMVNPEVHGGKQGSDCSSCAESTGTPR